MKTTKKYNGNVRIRTAVRQKLWVLRRMTMRLCSAMGLLVLLAAIMPSQCRQSTASTLKTPVHFAAVPFSLSSISITPNTDFSIIQHRNYDFLLSLDDTRCASISWDGTSAPLFSLIGLPSSRRSPIVLIRLLCLYTAAANTTGNVTDPTCKSYDHPMYYGHYLGHWLSATAMVVEVMEFMSPGLIKIISNLTTE